MLDTFASIVEDAGIICVGIVVDAEGYRKALVDPECHLEQQDANVFSFHTIIMRGIERIDMIDKHSPIAIIVDDDPQNVTAYYDLLHGLRKHPDERFEAVNRRINAISFCRDDDYPGLQASDMVAYLVRKYARERFTLGTAVAPPSLLYKLTHAGLHAPYFFDGQKITELGKNIKLAIESESAGMAE